jgi:hypothetical protein
MVLLWSPSGWRFLISEVALYSSFWNRRTHGHQNLFGFRYSTFWDVRGQQMPSPRPWVVTSGPPLVDHSQDGEPPRCGGFLEVRYPCTRVSGMELACLAEGEPLPREQRQTHGHPRVSVLGFLGCEGTADALS